MIKKLKLKFVLLSMTSLFILLTVMVVTMNVINYNTVISDADNLLNIMAAGGGRFPDFDQNKENKLPADISPERPRDTGHFSVLLDKKGNFLYADLAKTSSVNEKEAQKMAKSVFKNGYARGFEQRFRFCVVEEMGVLRILFLDCGRELDSYNRFKTVSISIAALGFIEVFIIIFFFAGKIIKPIAQSYTKQKQFITDAGHEIKTPLTVINANLDVLEMENGKSECLEDIRMQTTRLTDLTNDLIMLSRMEEAKDTLKMIEFPLSETVKEAVSPFFTVASREGKQLVCNIQPMISYKGNAKNIIQLVSTLVDNGIKYAKEDTPVFVELIKNQKNIVLSVTNTCANPLTKDQLSHLFDRFYRGDSSRNSDTGGHGIGLSIAKAIVDAHGGKISASISNNIFRINVVL